MTFRDNLLTLQFKLKFKILINYSRERLQLTREKFWVFCEVNGDFFLFNISRTHVAKLL